MINTFCWRADHEILIHDGTSRSELLFVSARQHVLISDNSPVKKFISILTLYRMRMQGYSDVYKRTILKRTSFEVECLHPTSSRREMCTSSVSNAIYHKFSHGAALYMLYGKNVNVILEFDVVPAGKAHLPFIYSDS